MNLNRSGAVVALALLFVPAVANAHIVKGVGDFYAGMLHPLTTIEHLIPLFVMGLLAGQSERKSAVGVLATFPLLLFIGAFLGVSKGSSPLVDQINLASMVILGALVALDRRIPLALLLLIAGGLGLSHGIANGAELTGNMRAHRFIPGVTLIGILVVAYGIGIVRKLKAPWTLIGVRVVGSWIAAIGLMVLALD